MSAVTDVNHIPELEAALRELTSKSIEVGWFESDNSHLAMIAGVQEYGATIPVSEQLRRWMAASGYYLKKSTTVLHVPERAPLRKSFEEVAEISTLLENAVYKAMGDYDSRKALNSVGVGLVRLVQRKINSNIGPKNHPFTLAHKNGEKTLVDKGSLVSGVAYKIK